MLLEEGALPLDVLEARVGRWVAAERMKHGRAPARRSSITDGTHAAR